MNDLDDIVLAFLRDAQFRVAELSVLIDKGRRNLNNIKDPERLRAELLQFIPIVYETVQNIADDEYNHLSGWTDREIISEIEYLRNFTGMNEFPSLQFTPYVTEILTQDGGLGGGAVDSVNGKTGVVILTTNDIPATPLNQYYLSALFDADFALKTTDDLAEGVTNRYYATALFDADLATKTTDDLAEGATNRYYTTALFDADLASKTSDDLAEGVTNRYYSTALFDADLASKTSDDIAEGVTNLYYSSALFDADLAGKTTDDLAEGTNLYYTEARVDANSSVVANTAKVSADGSVATHSDVDLSGITTNQILEWDGFGLVPVDKPVSVDFVVQNITHSAGSLNIDFGLGRIAIVTLEADVDLLTFTAADYEGILILLQDAVGNKSILSWSTAKSIDGVIPDYSLLPNSETFLNVGMVGGEIYIFGAGNMQTIGT